MFLWDSAKMQVASQPPRCSSDQSSWLGQIGDTRAPFKTYIYICMYMIAFMHVCVYICICESQALVCLDYWEFIYIYISISPSCMELHSVGQQKVTNQGAQLIDILGMLQVVVLDRSHKSCNLFSFCAWFQIDLGLIIKKTIWSEPRKITSPVSEPRDTLEGQPGCPIFQGIPVAFSDNRLPSDLAPRSFHHLASWCARGGINLTGAKGQGPIWLRHSILNLGSRNCWYLYFNSAMAICGW